MTEIQLVSLYVTADPSLLPCSQCWLKRAELSAWASMKA